METKIDFVVTWVDSNDLKWKHEKEIYQGKVDDEIQDCRYRDWGLFKYWFRGVEKYASWVNKVYLITYGHIPEWLNIDNPKLVIVNHKDYIEEKYLPTFNSNVIELNLNKINELSENFVLFNDDMYLTDFTKPEDFFSDGKPVLPIALNVHCPVKGVFIQEICFHNAEIINNYYEMKECIKSNKKLWFNLKNGKALFRTILLYNCPRFSGFYTDHLPVPHLKSTFEKLWDLEEEKLNEVSSHRFRNGNEINHWLMQDWNIVSGNAINKSFKFGKVFHIDEKSTEIACKEICECLIKGKYKEICINDTENTGIKFEKYIEDIIKAFDYIFPNKSRFEK